MAVATEEIVSMNLKNAVICKQKHENVLFMKRRVIYEYFNFY